MLQVKPFEFNMFGEMTYVVYDSDTRDAAVVDPGMMNRREEDIIDNFIRQNGLDIRHIISTHLHVDHVMGANMYSKKYGIGVSADPDDRFLGSRIAEQIQMFHLPVELGKVEIRHELHDGDRLVIGHSTLSVIKVPGHSPGSIALYSPEDGFVITGDALFHGSIGRTDLPGGDYATLIRSITDRLLTLPDATVVYHGHGDKTTIGNEKRFNPFL